MSLGSTSFAIWGLRPQEVQMLGSRMLKKPSFVSWVSLLFITLLVMVSLPGVVGKSYSSVTLNWDASNYKHRWHTFNRSCWV